jgi:hypothetical protein
MKRRSCNHWSHKNKKCKWEWTCKDGCTEYSRIKQNGCWGLSLQQLLKREKNIDVKKQ